MSLDLIQINISKQGSALFSPLSLSINAGQVFTLMGPSGCGKSTLLSAIAGHLASDFSVQGNILLNGRSVMALPANQRHIALLFQDDLLFPHLSVLENLLFAVPKAYPKQQRLDLARQTLEDLALPRLASQMPEQISGGQRARISLMRMLLSEPQAVLLDEPFNKLDQALRSEFRPWVFNLLKDKQIPGIMVTHDQADVPDASALLSWPWSTQEPITC